MSFRKEKKFRLSQSDILLAKSTLIKSGMITLHPSRVITSQYFDTKCLRMFSESEEGLLPRKKIRVRWYNKENKQLTFEEKTSSLEGRFKQTRKINSQEFNDMIKNGFSSSMYGIVHPTVKISYLREYFVYKGIRITFDSNISYRHFNSSTIIKDFERVMEIKSPFEASDDFLNTLFSTPTTRFSKYCRAFLLKDKI